MSSLVYPASAADRDAWIVSRRPAKTQLDPYVPYAYFVEEECAAGGEPVPVATLFLTNRECPFRCLMCDLWRNTLPATVPAGAIPAQIDHALRALAPARQLKLYNSGSSSKIIRRWSTTAASASATGCRVLLKLPWALRPYIPRRLSG